VRSWRSVLPRTRDSPDRASPGAMKPEGSDRPARARPRRRTVRPLGRHLARGFGALDPSGAGATRHTAGASTPASSPDHDNRKAIANLRIDSEHIDAIRADGSRICALPDANGRLYAMPPQ